MKVMSDLIVIPAELSHCLGMAEVVVGAWQISYRGFVPDEILDSLDTHRRAIRWREQIREDHSQKKIFVALLNHQVVGVAICGPCRKGPEDFDGELQTIYVRPTYYRQGIGRRLFEKCVESLREMSYRNMLIWTFAENVQARKFYERMGGQESAKSTISLGRVCLPEVAYGWTLSSFEPSSQPRPYQ